MLMRPVYMMPRPKPDDLRPRPGPRIFFKAKVEANKYEA